MFTEKTEPHFWPRSKPLALEKIVILLGPKFFLRNILKWFLTALNLVSKYLTG